MSAVTAALLGVLTAATTLAAPAAGVPSEGQLHRWQGTPTMLSGRTTIDRGELIYDDYLYDDYGADLDGLPNRTPFQSWLSSTNGDYRYPDDERYGHNAADLRQLRIAADARRLHVALHFQTLKAADTTIATVAIDTDGDRSTGARIWPDGIGLTTPGADRFITVWGNGGRVTDARGTRSPVTAAVDLAGNSFEARVPLAALGKVSDRARVWVVTGLADGQRYRRQQEGAPAVFDAGFQGAEKYGKVELPSGQDGLRYGDVWNDRRQADALAASDITELSHPLHLATLRAGESRPFRLKPGFYNRIFRSRYDYGEGVVTSSGLPSPNAPDRPMFASRYQPYGIYIPQSYRPSRPARLLIDGHSFQLNQNQYAALSPNRLRQLGEQQHSLIITPLGRSTDFASADWGLADVLEAWADARAHYRVDADRTSVSGMAAGGFLTYRLGLLMPDRFAKAAVHLGPAKDPTYIAPGVPIARPGLEVKSDTTLLIGNAFNLPYELNYSASAPLVPITGARDVEQRYRTAGNAYRFYDNPTLVEPFDVLYHDEWGHSGAWLGSGERRTHPVRVRYVRYPVNDLTKQGIRFDSAYWMADLRVRDLSAGDTAHGEIDATTFGLGGFRPTPQAEDVSVEPGEAPAIVTGQRQVDGAPIVRRNAFTATLRNLSSLRLLIGRMGLNPQRPLTATLTGDGTTTLHFDGTWPRSLRATLDSRSIPVTHGDRGIRLTATLPAGTRHALHLEPR